MTLSDDEISGFVPLAEYEAPTGPALHIVQRLRDRAVRLFREDDAHVVEDDRLKRATRATIGDFTASPDCSLLARELDVTLGDWADARDTLAADRLRLVVLPPVDVRDLLATWARRHGHAVLEPPGRDKVSTRGTVDLPELEGEGVLVLPCLEHWFLRHRHGLALVRELLAALADGERRCVIGCNSWAWSYLSRAADADLLLPEPITFAPFDAGRLCAWFTELAAAEETRAVTFRESGSDADVFARDEEGDFESDYLAGLAARSRGIPWVAWQLWQRNLRTKRVKEKNGGAEEQVVEEDEAEAHAGDDDKVLWVVPSEELVLPRGHVRAANLVLHALLIHGRLDVDELAQVLPFVGESNLVPALVRSGHVERVGKCYRCVPGAYPDIVESLSTAGVTMPRV